MPHCLDPKLSISLFTSVNAFMALTHWMEHKYHKSRPSIWKQYTKGKHFMLDQLYLIISIEEKHSRFVSLNSN